MAFYRLKHNSMTFQLLDLGVREYFSLWDNVNKKFLRTLDGVANLDNVKFMKADLFKQRYPNYRKNMEYLRHILVYDEAQQAEYDFGFKKTANDQIEAFIANMSAIKQNPLAVKLFMQISGIDIDKSYKITALETVGVMPVIKSLVNPGKSSLVKSDVLVLNSAEEDILALFEQDTNSYRQEEFIDTFYATLARFYKNVPLNRERIKNIYVQRYTRK